VTPRPLGELGRQLLEPGPIGSRSSPNDDIHRTATTLDRPAPDLLDPAPQTIAGHRRRLEPRDDQSQSGVTRFMHYPRHVEMSGPLPTPSGEDPADVISANQPVVPREPLRRQLPPCFVGVRTVSCLRPFFRRRARTSRPQRVAIRARNPCRLIRFRFRGRYVGCMTSSVAKRARKPSLTKALRSRLTFPHGRRKIASPRAPLSAPIEA
jgi:hypothetical protein